jgi:hypothetical protein
MAFEGVSEQVENSAVSVGSAINYNPYTCGDPWELPGSDFVGLFAETGEWFPLSKKSEDTSAALSKVILVEVVGVNDNWQGNGDLVVTSGGSVVYRSQGAADIDVKLVGRRAITLSGDVVTVK